jgi:hypothetical protein
LRCTLDGASTVGENATTVPDPETVALDLTCAECERSPQRGEVYKTSGAFAICFPAGGGRGPELDNLHFPDASGLELCGRLRDGEPGRRWNRDVPVIMVSARGDPVDRVRGIAADPVHRVAEESVPDYFENRLEEDSGWLKLVGGFQRLRRGTNR